MFLYKFSIDMNDIVVVFYFYSRRNKSKGHASCLFMNIIVDSVPWQRSYWEILRESHLLLYHRLLAISRVAEQQKTCLCCCIRPLVTPRRSYAIGVVCLSVCLFDCEQDNSRTRLRMWTKHCSRGWASGDQ